MLDASHIVRLQRDATRHWHDASALAPKAENEFDELVLAQHRANFDLWHEEDAARDPHASAARIVEIKQAIDRLNQQRNDLAERIDSRLFEAAGAQRAGAPLHSETPGMMIDRLSILDLKCFHTQQEIDRRDASEEHRQRNGARLKLLMEQREDLRGCLEDLWSEVLAGHRRFKLYHQLKMYNDPELNPVLYSSAHPQRE